MILTNAERFIVGKFLREAMKQNVCMQIALDNTPENFAVATDIEMKRRARLGHAENRERAASEVWLEDDGHKIIVFWLDLAKHLAEKVEEGNQCTD